MTSGNPSGGALRITVAVLAALFAACAVPAGDASGYRYFETPDPYDPWSLIIARWQAETRARPSVTAMSALAPEAAPLLPGDIQQEFASFRAELKRSLVDQVVVWIQAQSREHFVADVFFDDWPTLGETLASDGDDCDGLELLSFYLLRSLGFAEREVLRGIVYHPATDQHHMVTLWFEDQSDPWVIDPTGVATQSLRRMSELSGWIPLKVFNERTEFTVRRGRGSPARPAHE